MTLFDSTENWR